MFGHKAEKRGAVLNRVRGDGEDAELAVGHGAACLKEARRSLQNENSKLSLGGEYSPFLDAAGCAKLRKFRRVSGIPKSPHCNSAGRPMEEREPDAQKFINSIAQNADAKRGRGMHGR